MPSSCQSELSHIDQQLKSLFTKLCNVTRSERHEVLLSLERTIYRFVERVDAINAHSTPFEDRAHWWGPGEICFIWRVVSIYGGRDGLCNHRTASGARNSIALR
jgi:hypothetical protein